MMRGAGKRLGRSAVLSSAVAVFVILKSAKSAGAGVTEAIIAFAFALLLIPFFAAVLDLVESSEGRLGRAARSILAVTVGVAAVAVALDSVREGVDFVREAMDIEVSPVAIAAVILFAASYQAASGKNAIIKGMNLEEGATAVKRNGQIGGHKA
jgi:hypothetical protein